MAMNGDALGLAIKAAVDAVVAGGGPVDRDAMFKAMGNAIVQHIETNAVVTVITTTPGVTAGPATAPGTGTGSIS